MEFWNEITEMEGMVERPASSDRSSAVSEGSTSASSRASTASTGVSIGPHSILPPTAYTPPVITSPRTVTIASTPQCPSGELRIMRGVVAQARETGELPPTTASPHDSEAIIQDHALLSRLRVARGDPALPPPEEYTSMRVEAARRIRERDAPALGDGDTRQAATKRVEEYLRVVGQERRYYDLVKAMATTKDERKPGGNMGQEIVDEVVAGLERQALDCCRELGDVGRIGTTAETLDLTAGELDSTAGALEAVVRSLGRTANTLNTAAISISTTACALENTLSVMATQIGMLNSQLLVFTNLLQFPRSAPNSPASSAFNGLHQTQQTVVEGLARKEFEHATLNTKRRNQDSTPQHGTPGVKDYSYSNRTLWDDDSLFDAVSKSTRIELQATKDGERSPRGAHRKTGRRASRYVRIVLDKFLR